MSKNPNVGKAANAFAKAIDSGQVGAGWPTINHGMDAVDAAGLLVTPLHTRALEACKRMAGAWSVMDGGQTYNTSSKDAIAVGREAIELEKPKERWSIQRSGAGFFVFPADFKTPPIGVVNNEGGFTEAQARSVAKALNECDAS